MKRPRSTKPHTKGGKNPLWLSEQDNRFTLSTFGQRRGGDTAGGAAGGASGNGGNGVGDRGGGGGGESTATSTSSVSSLASLPNVLLLEVWNASILGGEGTFISTTHITLSHAELKGTTLRKPLKIWLPLSKKRAKTWKDLRLSDVTLQRVHGR